MTASTVIANPSAQSGMMDHHHSSQYEMNGFDDILNEVGLFVEEDMLLLDPEYATAKSPPPEATRSSSDHHFESFVPVSPEHESHLVSSAVVAATTTPDLTASSSSKSTGQYKIPNPIPSIVNSNILQPQPQPTTIERVVSMSLETEASNRRRESAPVSKPSKPNPKKRQLSTASVSDSSDKDASDKQMVERRERNREHAKRSRLRKKSLTQTLQQSLQDLKEENDKLRNQIYSLLGKEQTDTLVREKIASPAERFAMELKNPANRQVDATTQAFLQSLRGSLPSGSS